MPNYTLYYWSVPFRGQFVRAVLAYAGQTWTEGGDGAIGKFMEGRPRQMPVPFMGPPLLVDKKAKAAISQMPAILLYLGETLKLLPRDAASRALTLKIAGDANDVIDEMTLDGGRQMWTPARWAEYVPRLEKWMSLFEELGARHGLTPDSGFILGGRKAGIADVVTATLWSTMIERFPAIGPILKKSAPKIAGLTASVAALPPLAKLAAQAKKDYGDQWCGGEIEKSLRKVLKV
jgi:glutathione S-transferase